MRVFNEANPEVSVRSGLRRVLLLTPVYDDWESLDLLIARLDVELRGLAMDVSVIAVDDGSRHEWKGPPALDFIRTADSLVLRRNLGHQRAIAVGLSYVDAQVPCDMVVVMDADGEDSPPDVVRLIEAVVEDDGRSIVFARRTKRSEGVLFTAFYFLYRKLFRLLTGLEIQFGNFSAIPHHLLTRLVSVSEIWNHYASGVRKSRLPCRYVSTVRGRRLAGRSTMNFVSLVAFGLSAVSVHLETAGVRMIMGGLGLVALIVTLIFVVIGIRFGTHLAIPGWATYVVGILLLLLVQTTTLVTFFALMVLNSRNVHGFLPCRDYAVFVDRLERYQERVPASKTA